MADKITGSKAIEAGSITQTELASAVTNKLDGGANTVRVYANSASSQNSVALNFINTSSISVTVEAGSTGNANVSFAFTGSGTPDFVLHRYGIT